MREDCTQNNIVMDGFDIATWYSEGVDSPYIAVNMTVSRKMLAGYSLTEEEKTSLPEMMGGYCRLIEESRLIGYGETEFEAIADLFSNATLTAVDA